MGTWREKTPPLVTRQVPEDHCHLQDASRILALNVSNYEQGNISGSDCLNYDVPNPPRFKKRGTC